MSSGQVGVASLLPQIALTKWLEPQAIVLVTIATLPGLIQVGDTLSLMLLTNTL